MVYEVRDGDKEAGITVEIKALSGDTVTAVDESNGEMKLEI